VPRPAVASSRAALSRTDKVRACSVDSPPRPRRDRAPWCVRPRVGLRPTSPQQAAGARIEPKPSEPWAPAASASQPRRPLPPLDPPEMRVRSQGLWVAPVELRLAGEAQAQLTGVGLAKDDSPARFQPFDLLAVLYRHGVGENLQARVVGTPRGPPRDLFTKKGTPVSGPSGKPAIMAWRP